MHKNEGIKVDVSLSIKHEKCRVVRETRDDVDSQGCQMMAKRWQNDACETGRPFVVV